MIRPLSLSLVTCALLASNVSAQVIELKEGQNLVSVNSKYASGSTIPLANLGEKVTAISSFDYVLNPFTGIKTLQPVSVSSINPSQAYWITSSEDTNISIGTLDEDVQPSLVAGWNFVGIPSTSKINDLVSTYNKLGYKLNSISSFDYVKNPFTGQFTLQPVSVTDLKYGKGYWAKFQKLSLRTKTSDGIYLDFYADDTSDTLPSNLTETISSLTYEQIKNGDLSTSFTSFSGEVVISTQDEYTDEISEVSHNVVTVDSNGIAVSNLPDTTSVVEDTSTITNVVVYVYSLEEAGSPQIVAGATLVKIEDDGNGNITETELGTSDSNGLIVPTEDIRGSKVVARADGLADITIALDTKYDKPSFYAILPSGQTEEVVEEADTPSQTTSRILGKELDREISKYKSVKRLAVYHMNQVSVEMGTKQRFTITQNSVPDASGLEEALVEDGYLPTIITSLDVTMKKSTTNKRLNPSNITFDDLYYSSTDDSKYNSDIDAFYLGLFGKKSNYNYGSIDLETIYADVTSTAPNGKIEVYAYKNNTWTKLSGVSTIKTVSSLDRSISEEKNVKKRLKKSDYFIKLTDVGLSTTKEYNGYYPLAVVYKQKNVTQKEFDVVVKDSKSNSVIPNALVRLGASNYVTDNNGSVKLSVTVTGDGALIPLTASEPKHLRTIASVDPSTLTDDDSDTVTMKLDPVPDTATITGTVLDRDSKDGVSNAKVDIVNPISLDIAKTVTVNGIRGIEVGVDSSAKYTWYVKVASSNVTPSNSRILSRVSETSWTQVKEANGKDGSFVSYNEILKTLLDPVKSDAESDAIAGIFDIAVKVEHDVDGDGTSDYIEMAIGDTTTVLNESNSNTTDINSTSVSNDFVQNYGKKIGQLKVALDAVKVADSSSNAADSGEVIFITDSNEYYQDTSGESFEDKDGSDAMEDSYANYDLSIGGGSDIRAFRIDGFSTDLVGDNAELTWKAAIFADIVDGSNQVVSSVLLDENMQWQAIKDEDNATSTYEELLAIQRGKVLANDNNFVVGSLKYVEGNLVSADSTISYKRLMRALANDKIIKALNKSIADVASEAGVSTTGVSDTSIKMLKDGITVSLVADIKYTRDPQDANESVRAILHTEGLTLKSDKVEDLLTITDTPVSPLSQVAGTMSTYSDRVGEFRFARVPYDFGKLNESQSLMRIEADRFDYFSNSANVQSFEQLESQLTTVQQNVDIKAKSTYSITLDLGDSSTSLDDVTGATVVISGQKSNNGELATYTIGSDGNLSSLSRTIPNADGITPTFSDIMEGYQTLFVFKDGFKPVKKSLNLTSNQTLKVDWETVADPAEFKPEIDIDYDSSSFDDADGKVVLIGYIVDKENETLSDDAEVSLMINNKPLSTKFTIDRTTGKFLTNFEVPKGKSEVKVVATNDKGVSVSSSVYFEYNPDFGALKGDLSGVKSDEFAIVSIFNEDNEPVANAVPSLDSNGAGEFNFISLPVGKYTISAVSFDTAGNDYPSNTISAEVLGGKIVTTEDLVISHSSEAISGAPVVEFTQDSVDLNASQLSELDSLTLNATVDNFEFGDDVANRFSIVINDVEHDVSKSNFTVATEANSYTFNYDLSTDNLYSGQNVVYLIASNKNGKYDFSADLYIKTPEVDNSVSIKDIEFIDKDSGKTISDDYVYLDLYNYSGDLKAHYTSDYNGTDNFIVTGSLDSGKYIASIYTTNENYVGFNTLVDVNSTGAIKIRNTELPDNDNDNMYDISLKKQSDNSNIEPVLSLPTTVTNLTTTDNTSFTFYDIASDADGDSLTITLGSDYDINVASAIVNSDNSITVKAEGDGKTTISVSVTDGTSTVEGSFVVNVTTPESINFPPNIFASTSINFDENYVSEEIELFDPEDDNLTVTTTLNTDVATVTRDGNILTVTGVANGTTTLVLVLSDGVNTEVKREIEVNVDFPVEDSELVTPPSIPDINTSTEVTITLPPSVPSI